MKDHLIKLGYTNNEAKVLLLLVELGPSLASTLARLAKIKRPTIYITLEKLEGKGLINKFKKAKFTYFAVDDIKKIYLEEKERYNTALEFLEELKGLKKESTLATTFEINYYKGKEGFRSIHEEILDYNPKEIIGWINFDHFYQGIDKKEDQKWTGKRIKKGISVKLISPKTKLSEQIRKDNSKKLREIKIDKEKDFTCSCILYNENLCFFESEKEFTGIKISNKEIVNLVKQIFKKDWEKT